MARLPLTRPQDILPGPPLRMPGSDPAALRLESTRLASRLRWSATPGNFTSGDNPKTYPAVGSYFLITRIAGASVVYVQFNQGQPFVPMREGEVWAGDFNSVTLLATNPIVDVLGAVSTVPARILVEAYYSAAPMLQPQPLTYGVRPPLVVQTGVASAAPTLVTPPVGSTGLRSTFGSYGGTLWILNDSLAAQLLFGYGTIATGPADPLNCMKIYPGVTFPIQFDRRMIRPNNDSDAGQGLFVLTAGGNCDFRVLFSTGQTDLADPDQRTTPSGIPNLGGG